ncbi:hypothetical protein J3D55_003759 [Chryseobacterium ginsenosidimutans]|uniref:hypothetical protein n=1 Tax=Chryseobacterium ginsenosidimutans TaxID=687846 RepID=UPI0021682BE5|nr:hypothetical protein [Chryseobacterium ginsenosidimutans]MCS3870843.1 hypothetical protein [Chryseobacterium ginsenosidimutans]
MDINLVLRSKIVHCSLNVENAINELLLKYLLITDKSRTKNFGNRAGISFKNKIDLLFDIDVFDKDELYIVELLMVFRNKFLHDIKYSSFTILLNDLDASIRNKFLKSFLNGNDENEEGYEKSFMNLYEKVVEIINNKTKEINSYSNKKIEFLKFQNYFLSTLINESLDLSGDLNNIIAEVEDVGLKNQIQQRIAQFEGKINYKENIEKFNSHLNDNVIKLMLKID